MSTMVETVETQAQAALLRVEHLAKAFGPTRALRDCSLELRRGEVHALMGENGSGKSTLVKILAGVHRPDAGRVVLAGEAARAGSPRAAIAAGVATVFQEVQCVPAQSVLENLWLGADGIFRRGRETKDTRDAKGVVPATGTAATARRARAEAVLTELLGACPDIDAPAGSLSLSERQALAIGRALLRDPRVLILDEATSALDVATRDRLFAATRRLAAGGGSVLFISHRMDEVEQIADRITVLRSGESAGTLPRAEAGVDRLVELMTGGEQLVQPAVAEAAREPGPVVLEIGGLDLRAGQIIGLAGLEGQGQSEFLSGLIDRAAPGQRRRIAYVPRDRREESVFPPLSVRENFAAATLGRDARAGLLSPARARARFAGYRDRLGIRLGRDTDAITTLSGGNQQKVVIARALAADPEVLLLNDPTRGVDLGAKRDVYALLRELAAQGKAVVMLSTEVDEHLELMDRVLVFREGRPAAELDRGQLSRTALVREFFGRDGGDTDSDDDAVGPPPAPASAPAPAPPARRSISPLLLSHTWLVPAVLAVLLLIANAFAQHSFLAWHSWPITLAELAPPALAAMAATPSILGGGGGIDISVAPLFTLVSVVIEVMLFGHGITGAALVVPVAVLFGAAVGAINGLMVCYGRFQPVVATLCMNFILSGIALAYAPSPVSGSTGWIKRLGSTIGGVPGALIPLAAALLLWFALRRTPFVRTLAAVGGSETTAYTAGVNVLLVRTLAYCLGGALAGLAGLAIVAQLHQAEADAGFVTPFILMSIAAAALGGTALSGGRGGLVGSLLGAAVIFLIQNLLTACGLSSNWSQAAYGATLIAAVLFAARTSLTGGRAR